MHYLIEAIQRNRVVKVIIRTPDYDRALPVFQKTKAVALYRETRFLKVDDVRGRILLKFATPDSPRNVHHKYAR